MTSAMRWTRATVYENSQGNQYSCLLCQYCLIPLEHLWEVAFIYLLHYILHLQATFFAEKMDFKINNTLGLGLQQ